MPRLQEAHKVRDIPKPKQPITDPRKLAEVLATVVTNYPHLLKRTGAANAETIDGRYAHASTPEAARFCAGGMIRRLEHNGVTNEATGLELFAMLRDLLGTDVATWWEDTEPAHTAADYAALLRRVAAE